MVESAQEGTMSAKKSGGFTAEERAARRKHTAPRKVPALARGISIMAPVFGNTKLARADAIKATEPSMSIHAIDQGSDLDRRRHNPTPRAEIARALATRNRMEPKMSGRQTCLSACATVRLCTVATNVLMLKKSVPGNCVAAAIQFLSPGRQAHGSARTRVCWRCSSTSVIPGL